MKKVFFSLAVLCSVALVSCGGNKAAEATDSESIVAVEAVDTLVAVDSAKDTVVAVEAVEAVEAAPADSAK